MKRLVFALVPIALSLTGALAMPTAHAQGGSGHPTIVVDDDKQQCPQAQYTDLRLAAAAAPAGATILVCPGTYPGPVNVTKQLTFIAQSGDEESQRDTHGQQDEQDNSQRAIVVGGANGDGFTLASNSAGTTIQGFVITGGAQPIFHAGINVTDPSGTGYTVLDNFITRNNVGMYFHSVGGAKSRIEHNVFVDNNEGGFPSPNTGTAIFTQLASVNDTTISGNFFSNHIDSDLNLGDGSQHGLVIQENLSVKDTTFLVLGRANGSIISRNFTSGTQNGSAIYLFGDNTDVQVVDNHLEANVQLSSQSSGIRLTGPNFGTVGSNTKMTIARNEISNFDYGIRGANVDNSTFDRNSVHDNTVDGIELDTTAINNRLTQNHASKSGVLDCEDLSVGTGTAGTANTWSNDHGKTASPPGICH